MICRSVVRMSTARFRAQALRVGGEGVLENDVDRDGDHLRVKLLTGPDHGQVSLKRDGTFVYRPSRGLSRR